jgi:putative ABC transport system permease protein
MSFPNFRIAVRHLRRSPGFSITAVNMLALAIGATTAVFSIVEAVLLRPLPFPHSERLVFLGDVLEGANVGGTSESGVTSRDILNYIRDTRSFESLGGYQRTSYELSGFGEPSKVNATRMTGGLFPALGVGPQMGRLFTQQEDDGNVAVAVISHSLWQNQLHGDQNVLGRAIQLDRKSYVVIGVMPRDFEFPLRPGHLDQSELWIPMSFDKEELGQAGSANWDYNMVGRLKPGITQAQAQEDAERVAKETMRNYPPFMSSLHIRAYIRSLHEVTIREARQLIRILFLAVVVVLLIACANLAGLLLVRAIRRRREFAMRLALGAGGFALLRQAVLESLVLGVSGGAFGLLLASAALRFGISQLPETLPRVSEIGLDLQVVTFAIAISVLTGVVCGSVPAFAAARTSVNETLKEGGRTGSAGGHAWLRSSLVVAEIAVALVLLAAAGLLLRSFEKMRTVDIGYRADHVISAAYSLPQKQYAAQPAIDGFNHELIRRLQQLPGVKFAGFTDFLPASGGFSNSVFVVEGYVPPPGADMNLAAFGLVEGDYLQAMGVPLLTGRFFTPGDTADSLPVAIINHKLAEHYWPGADPLGKRFRVGTPESPTAWLTVVGEIGDMKVNARDEPDREQWYQPVEQFKKALGPLASPEAVFGNNGFIALRTATQPELMTNSLRATVRSVDPQLALTKVQTMEQAISDSEAPRRFNTGVISAFAFAAVLLSALGIYSVITFSAALRLQEMAIRMALGSQRSGILGLVFLSAVKLALAGCAIGLIATAAASRLLDSFLFAVNRFDPLVLSLAAVFVVVLSLVASLLPAARAASIDPMAALRAD